MQPSDFTLPTDSAVTVHVMGEGELVLSQRNETTGKTERVALGLDDLRVIVATLEASRYGQPKNIDHRELALA